MRPTLPVFAVVLAGLSVGLLAVAPPVPGAAPAGDALVERVRKAIDGGVAYLRGQQRQGNWEVGAYKLSMPGGCTSLALLALLNSGVPPQDEAVQKGLAYLRTIPPSRTYVVGLQTMVFALARQGVDRERLQRNVDWLLAARMADGWGYGHLEGGRGNASRADSSNTQYALLGLHEALQAGARVDRKALQELQDFYVKTQREGRSGGWGYRPGTSHAMTMTTAGLCGLLITGMDLAAGKQQLRPDGSAADCGVYVENRPASWALEWLGSRFPARLTEENAVGRFGSPFYCLYGIERTGRLTGERYLGGHDWYEIGCRFLTDAQKADGSWRIGGDQFRFEHEPVIATSFALLFLSKGRTPVLVTKLAHGPADDLSWNNKRSDVRHLVDFCSRELFKKQPLAWQIFDVRRHDAGAEQCRKLAEELLPSPVVYVNGHYFRPAAREVEILREYLANGGFLFAEACCGSPTFAHEFGEVMKELFPDTPLQPLEPGHPVWLASGKFRVPPNDPFPLYGIQQGCKTVVIFSPKPLAGYWEGNRFDQDERGRLAFQLGANVIAYATGLEPPRPRLTEAEVVRDDPQPKVRRGYLKVAQLKHGGDWHPAPKAMRHLMAEVRKLGLDVVLKTGEVAPAAESVLDYRFLYMHGRAAFAEKPADLKHLAFNLKTGGTLFADACCGSPAFDKSFRKFVEALWTEENAKLPEGQRLKLVPIPTGDELFGKDLNGTAIERVRRREAGPEFRHVPPALEGVQYNGRWVVIYSKYDIGCALEKHQSTDCRGHDYDSAARLGKAAVLYALKR